jgi:hypothetical protein
MLKVHGFSLLLIETECVHNITLHAHLQSKVCEVGKVIPVHVIQAYQGMGVELLSFSTLELDENEWLVSRYSRFAR